MHPQPLAYRSQEFLESDEARPLRILAEYLEPLRRFKAENIQDTVVFFGSARIHSPEQAREALERLERRFQPGAGECAESSSRAQPQGRGVVALLRGRARAGAHAHGVDHRSRHQASPLRRRLRRRPRHHGGRQPRRRRGRRQDDRAEYPTALRAGGQSIHHRGSALRVPLLLHAQVLVCVPRQGAGDLPRRLWHARRDVRDPDVDAD